MESSKKKLRVAIIGAGASGMAAAWSLSRYPDMYEVHVIEPAAACGGVACSFDHTFTKSDGQTCSVPVNYGVQGGSPAAHQNTIELMNVVGQSVAPCELSVSFGKGEHNWKNYEHGPLQKRLRSEIQRFERVLRWVARLEFVTIFMSIDCVLRLHHFSADFRQRMVYPLVALFFGTGNQTQSVSAAIVARVFLDKSMALFEYHKEYLLNQTPQNIAFPPLDEFYDRLRVKCEEGGCRFHLRTRASSVVRGGKNTPIRVQLEKPPEGWRGGANQDAPGSNELPGKETTTLEVDRVIFACAANAAHDIISDSGVAERRVLSSVEYFNDLTVTHTDEAYMARHNEVDGKAIYFIKTYDKEPALCEMGFDLTAYQPALKPLKEEGTRVYQTIYLDEKRRDLWTIDELDQSKVMDRTWWVAFSHTFKHFRRVVPWVWTIQNPGKTLFAGSWTLFNTHDIAISSGLAAAEQLGAPYPFEDNPMAKATFLTVLRTSHLVFRRNKRHQKPRKYT